MTHATVAIDITRRSIWEIKVADQLILGGFDDFAECTHCSFISIKLQFVASEASAILSQDRHVMDHAQVMRQPLNLTLLFEII